MFLEQKATDVTTEDVLKGIEQLGNLDFSKIKMSSLIEKLVEWAATTGFKLIVGALIISYRDRTRRSPRTKSCRMQDPDP